MKVISNKWLMLGALCATSISGASQASQLCSGDPIPRQGEVPINQTVCLTNYGHYLEFKVPYSNSDVTITTSGGTYSGTLDADLILYTGDSWNADEVEQQVDNPDSNDETMTFVSRSGMRKLKINGNISQTSLTITVTGGDVPPPLGDYVVYDTNVQVDLPAPAISSKAQYHQSVQDILQAAKYKDYLDNNPEDPINHVSDALHYLASVDDISDSDLTNLLYFVGYYSGYMNDSRNTNANPTSDSEAAKLSTAMHAVAKMSGFQSTQTGAGKVQSAYANAVGIFNKGNAANYFADQLPHIMALVQYISTLSNPYSHDGYGDSTKAVVSLLGYAAKYGDSPVIDALNAQMINVLSVLRSYALLGETAWDGRYTTEFDRSWIIHTTLKSIASVGTITNQEATDRINSMIIEIHNKLSTALSSQLVGTLVNYNFLDELNRTCDSNDALANYCQSEDDVLSVVRQCDSNYTIRAQAPVTQAQLTTACNELADQETRFHNQFNTTAGSPVADDNNATLDIAVFSSPDTYKLYAGMLFGISTDNGGIYLEGKPEEAGNKARFIAKICADSWVGYSCDYQGQVYNLRHEFTHYLDGRYNKYGGYKYNKYATAWTEGMAEYVSNGNNYPRTLGNIKGKVIPPLYNILLMDYGYDDLYEWGYFAMHYLVNQHPDEITSMAQALRSSDTAAWEALVKGVAERTAAGFEAYVLANSEAIAANVETIPPANTVGGCELQQQYVVKVDANTVTGSVTNTTDTPVSLFWINRNTGEYVGSKNYKTLGQGDSYSFTTWRENDRMMMTDNNYNCLAVAPMTQATNEFTIKPADVVNAKQETIPPVDTLGSCDLMDRHIKDVNGTGAFSITNTTNYPVSIVRVDDTTGKPLYASQYGTLKQGETLTQTNWYKDRRLMVADARLNCLAVGVLNNESTSFTIDSTTIANAAPEEVLPAANTIGSCELIEKHYIDTVGYPMSITNNSDTPVSVYRVLNDTGEVNWDTVYATLQPGESYEKDAAKAWYGKRRAVLALANKQCIGVTVLSEKAGNTFSITQDLIPDTGGGIVDSDGDGVADSEDTFPHDPNESKDSDNDGVGDNADAFPNDASETTDSDGDNVGDNADAFPNDASESKDENNNGVGDNQDTQFAARYCTQSGGSQGYEWITSVKLNDVERTSGKDNGGFSDFTDQTINLAGGSTVNLALSTNNTSDNEYWYVWIDYNNDGDFADANELVYEGRSGSNALTTSTFNVPAGLNVATRMRVTVSYRSIADACASVSYGEVEDYSIRITSDGNSSSVPNACATETPRTNGRLTAGEATCIGAGSNLGFSIADVSSHNSIAITTAHGSGDISLRYNNGSWPGSSNNDGESNNANTSTECIYVTGGSEYWGYLLIDGSTGGTSVIVEFDTAGCRN